jgi:hypothetical protein
MKMQLRVEQARLHAVELAELDNVATRLSMEAESARAAIATAQEETAKANKATQELRQNNLVLEKAIAPRELEQLQASKALAQFSDIKFTIVSTPDPEARRTAAQIRFLLTLAGLKKFEGTLPSPPQYFPDGISIEWGQEQIVSPDRRSWNSMLALIEQLKASDVAARFGRRVPELAPAGLRILVGLKPISLSNAPSPQPAGSSFRGTTFVGELPLNFFPPNTNDMRGNMLLEN